MVDHFPLRDTFGFDWWFCSGHEMTWGDSSTTLSFALWRPLDFFIEGVEELVEWEAVVAELEVKDVEFDEDRVEVVQFAVNLHQLQSSGVDPYWIQGGCRHWGLWPSLRLGLWPSLGRGVRYKPISDLEEVLVLEVKLLPS